MEKKMRLKLLVNKESQKVLFAETGKDFVDFLSNLLQLPLGCVARLLDKSSMVGCLGNLYRGIEHLDDSYFQSGLHKHVILNPTSSWVFDEDSTLLLLPTDSTTKRYYRCGNANRCFSCQMNNQCEKYVTCVRGTNCPQCKGQMITEVTYVGDDMKRIDAGKGYVKDAVTYLVKDDLAVAPMSIFSSITLLKKLNIKNAGVLEKRTVEVGMEEGLAILKQSLRSKTVLSDVFLGEKPAGGDEDREGLKGASEGLSFISLDP